MALNYVEQNLNIPKIWNTNNIKFVLSKIFKIGDKKKCTVFLNNTMFEKFQTKSWSKSSR